VRSGDGEANSLDATRDEGQRQLGEPSIDKVLAKIAGDDL
jgi:hypothetical protein